MKVLVADDSGDSIQLMRDLLENRGYAVVAANDGSHTIEMAHSEMPDLIILDVAMPDMSGFEVCTRLKSDPATSHIPILMLSALSEKFHETEGLSAGAEEYITKPFRYHELMARIDHHLQSIRPNE